MLKCGCGERLNDIFILSYFREIRICYVYNGQSDTRDFCSKKTLVFVMIVINKRVGTRGFFLDYLQNSRETNKNISYC